MSDYKELLKSAITTYRTVFHNDLELAHNPAVRGIYGIYDRPKIGDYAYIRPEEKNVNHITGEVRFVVHGCIDPRVVLSTQDDSRVNVNRYDRIMTTAAGGPEQSNREARFNALAMFLAQLRNASEINPDILLLVHAWGKTPCAGFCDHVGDEKVSEYRRSGEEEDQLVERARVLRNVVWADSSNSRGSIEVGCVVLNDNDSMSHINYYN